MLGNKPHNTFALLAGGAAVSAFMFAADPAIADPAATNDNANNNNMNNEIVFITRLHGGLNEERSEGIIRDLRTYAAMDPEKEITFYINSPGGLLWEALAIYDTMQDIPNDIRTVCEGQAMSAGMTLLAAGTPGKRQALPNCTIMAHQSSSGAGGHIEDSRLRMESNRHANEQVMQLIADHSGWDVDTLTDMMSHDVYLTPEEAQEMGFIDEITEPEKPRPTTTNRKTLDDLPDWFCEGERAKIVRACAAPYRAKP